MLAEVYYLWCWVQQVQASGSRLKFVSRGNFTSHSKLHWNETRSHPSARAAEIDQLSKLALSTVYVMST